MKKSAQKVILQGHFIPNSHLDREWGLDYQQTRKMTVDFLDALLDIFDKVPEYTFLLDSQTIPLEDYLEIRPENEERLKKVVAEGRLSIGPWYTAPDCNCINGESIVRNLLMGHRVAKRFGRVMKVGYTPFGFGQVSQMPQIYGGFGIDTALFYRGITGYESPMAEFLWQSPDGTEALCSRFGCAARYNFYFFVWRPTVCNGKKLRERLHDWTRGGGPFKLCDSEHRFDSYFLHDPNSSCDTAKLEVYFRELIAEEVKHFSTPVIPLMQGMDSSKPDIREVQLLSEIRNFLARGESVEFSTMSKFIRALKRSLRGKKLKRFKGEMRHPGEPSPCSESFVDIVSARPRQKQMSEKAERMLQRWAEPFAVFAWLAGEEYPEQYLEIAWKFLLQCHAHDTIGGCGVDALEQDATSRLRQVVHLSDMLLRSSLGALQKRADTNFCAPEDVVLTVFNPSPVERAEVVRAFVDVPESFGDSSLRLFDSEGKEVDMFEGRRRATEKVIRSYADVTTALLCHETDIHFLAESVPAMGYKTFALRSGEPIPVKQPLAASPARMENECLSITLHHDGTLSLCDKKNGREFHGLHVFEDGGEAGDAWVRKPPASDRIVTSVGCPVHISIECNNHLTATLKARYEMVIPEGWEHDSSYEDTWRSSVEKPLIIESYFTLRKHCPFLEIETHVDNQHKNHRLRVLFPTRLKAACSFAEQPFDVVARPIQRGPDSPYRFSRNPTYPFLRFVDISDNAYGLALLSDGMREYEAVDDEERTLALTLIRAFEISLCTVSYRWERLPEMEGSQSLGKHVFRYALYPHAGRWDKGDVLRQAEAFSLPMLTGQGARGARADMPANCSFVEVSPPDVMLSAVKRSESGKAVIVRVYNPTGKARKTAVKTAFALKNCAIVALEEKRSRPTYGLTWSGNTVTFTLPPGKVVTLRIVNQKRRTVQ